MKKYAIICFALVLFASLGLAGCSPKAETTSTQEDRSTENKEYGQITAIEGSKITVTLGDYQEQGNVGSPEDSGSSDTSDSQAFDMNDSANTQSPQGGTPPEMPQGQEGAAPSGDAQDPSGGTPPQGDPPAEGEAPTEGEAPNMGGTPPDGSGEPKTMGVPGFTATDETKDYTIGTSVTVTDSQGNAMTLDDLQEGDVLAFTLTDSQVTAIEVLIGDRPENMAAPGASGDASGDTSSTENQA